MHRFSWLLVAVAVFLVFSGCRSYGGRYGVEEATYRQIAPAIEDLDAELQRVRGLPNVDQVFLQDELALRTESFVTYFDVLVDGYRARYDEMSPSSSYRDLSRVYRAIVTDYHTLRAARQRAELSARVDLTDESTGMAPQMPYSVAPIFYQRLEGGTLGTTSTSVTSGAAEAADDEALDDEAQDDELQVDEAPADDSDG